MSVAEHYARYSRIRSSHASWRLLAATNAPLILAFLTDLFAQVSEVPFCRAKVALEAELLRWKEARVEVQDSASAYLRQWMTSGWLREQDGVLFCTDSSEIALRFTNGLEHRNRCTTASHLR